MTPQQYRAAGKHATAELLERLEATNPLLLPLAHRLLDAPIETLRSEVAAFSEYRRTRAQLRAEKRGRDLDLWRVRQEDAPDDPVARQAVADLTRARHEDERSGLVAPRLPIGQPAPAPARRKVLPFRPRRFR